MWVNRMIFGGPGEIWRSTERVFESDPNDKLTLIPIFHSLKGCLGYRILKDFVYEDDINTYGSCSLMFRGSMMLFGGYGSKGNRQLLSVGDCSLKLEGQLPFEFHAGACEIFDQSQNGESALLCFHSSSPYKDCYTWVVKHHTQNIQKFNLSDF